MYQINKRFFIGIGIIEALCLIFWIFGAIGFPVWASAAITLVLNTAYFTLFFVGLKMINEEEADLQKQIEAHDPNLVFKVSKQDIEKIKKEGALMVDGKELINRDFELWKENKKHQERQ
jgi:hypothetical protein